MAFFCSTMCVFVESIVECTQAHLYLCLGCAQKSVELPAQLLEQTQF